MTLDEHNDAVRVMLGDLLRRQETLEAQLLEIQERESLARKAERAEDIARQKREARTGRRLGIAAHILEYEASFGLGRESVARAALAWADALLAAEEKEAAP